MCMNIKDTKYWDKYIAWMISYNSTIEHYYVREVYYSMVFNAKVNVYLPFIYDDGTAVWRRNKPLVIIR